MPQFNVSISASMGGISAPPQYATVTDELLIEITDTDVPAAQGGNLTTRTNNTSGSLTMDSVSHGIITGQRVDLYWADGSCFGATVGTVSGATVPIASVLGGDVLPSAATDISVGIAQSKSVTITGANASAILITSPYRGHFSLETSAPAATLEGDLVANVPYVWYTGNGITNPITGVTIAKVWLSHANEAAAQQMSGGVLAH